MNSKAFAIFVGAIMVFSAFAGFVLLGTEQSEIPVAAADSYSLENFKATGNLVDWDFEGLQNVLEMAPENTVMAYWVNLSAPANLTAAARAALPQSMGFSYGSQMYQTSIERLAGIYFNGSWTEMHWIKPYQVGYSSLVIPYENYMMIPTGNDYVTVLGKPVLFGMQEPVERVVDVITGGLSSGHFTLVGEERADLQLAALGLGGKEMPLSGAYDQFYLEISAINGSIERYSLDARLKQPQSEAISKLKDIASASNLSYSAEGAEAVVSGALGQESLQGALMALMGP
jgi:hypothetical protein